MNFADSLKHVLKYKTQNILSEFWKRDLKIILAGFGDDIAQMYKSGTSAFQQIRSEGMKISFAEVKDSLSDTLLILRVLPSRMKQGFVYLKEDLLTEMDKQTDAKQKAIFSFKILGALVSFTLGIFYNVQKGKAELNLRGLKRSNAFTKFIVAELIFKISQHFLLRILTEVEAELTESEDKKNIRYFRQLLSARKDLPETSEKIIQGDSSLDIIENFKHFIMTGKRRSS